MVLQEKGLLLERKVITQRWGWGVPEKWGEEGVFAKEDEGMVPAKEDGMGGGWRKRIPPVNITKKNVTTNCTRLQENMIIV